MAKKSWADKAREKQQKSAEKAASRTGSDIEWTPDIGTHRIRVLPPLPLSFDVIEKDGTMHKAGSDDAFFYMTHSYHFMDGIGNEGRGKLLWAPKKFDVTTGEGLFYHGHEVKTKIDPIDECVRQLYETGRAEKNEEMQRTGGKIKRKRQFFFNIILLDEEDPEKKFKILIDKTNEGKLTKKICEHMNFPFYRDIEDEWVKKESLAKDPDRTYYDLVDIEEGYDFKIVKESTGDKPWDISYDQSFPITKAPRALTDDEKLNLDKRVDLRTYVKYSTFSEIQSALDEYFDLDDKVEVESTPAPSAVDAKKAKEAIQTNQAKLDDDANIDDILSDLDDE